MMLFMSNDFIRVMTVESVEDFDKIPKWTFTSFGNGEMDSEIDSYVREVFIRTNQIESVEYADRGYYLDECEMEYVTLARIRTTSGKEYLTIVPFAEIGEIDFDYLK